MRVSKRNFSVNAKANNAAQIDFLNKQIVQLAKTEEDLEKVLQLKKELALRQKFDVHFICIDQHKKTFIDEKTFFFGLNKITPGEFNVLMALRPPITVDYIVRDQQEKSLLSRILSYRLSIEKTMAFWLMLTATLFKVAPKDEMFLPIFYGFFSWFIIEQGYHRLGHRSVDTESSMLFVYGFHWRHHMEPDRPGNTVSPPIKNMILAAAIFLLFQMMRLPNPVLAMAVLTVQFSFYELMHWLAHTKRPSDFKDVPFIGNMIANIIANHRAHHVLGGRYAISSGSLFARVVNVLGMNSVTELSGLQPCG